VTRSSNPPMTLLYPHGIHTNHIHRPHLDNTAASGDRTDAMILVELKAILGNAQPQPLLDLTIAVISLL
jgi:hypothetical protein